MLENEEKIVVENVAENVENRLDLITTAVKFLKNPKVAQTAESAKREFLLKKGLTDSEIKSAFEQVSTFLKANPSVDTSVSAANLVPSTQMTHFNAQQAEIKPNMISILIKWIRNFLLAGCLAFTAYKLIIKKYVVDKKKKIEKKKTIDMLAASNQKLVDNIIEMKLSIQQLKDSIELMSSSTGQTSKIGQANMDDSAIRAEIQTIKNLLLNRSQFPNLPVISPILPSWQLENKNVSKEKSAVNLSSENDQENEAQIKEI